MQLCQNSNSQSAGGFRFYDTNRSNIDSLTKQSEVDFTMKSFWFQQLNGKKVEVKFDAFKDAMYIRFNDNYSEYLLPSKNNFVILIRRKRTLVGI